jgi:DNA-binding NarL/FixJ family response regulator
MTPYERRLLEMKSSGMRIKEIAATLCRSEQTIKNTLCKIYKKTNVGDRYAYHHEIALQNESLTP